MQYKQSVAIMRVAYVHIVEWITLVAKHLLKPPNVSKVHAHVMILFSYCMYIIKHVHVHV